MDRLFSSQIRVVLCMQCGNPVEGAAAGGSVPCRQCGTPNTINPRDDRPLAANTGQPPVAEPERMTRLRQQDGRPMMPPASIQQLIPNGKLEPWKVNEAFAVWQQSRIDAGRTGNYEAADRLMFLTIVLAGHFFEQKDLIRQRALYESALDAVSLPRHKQMLRGFLCRNAVLAGDLAAAQEWLSPCDPRSDDLESDSAYRMSWAFIGTAQGNFQMVLQALGSTNVEVPIMDAMDAQAAVFRANAWEKLGQVQNAVQVMTDYMSRGGAGGRQAVERIIQLYAPWGLCTQSFAAAAGQYTQAAGKAAAARASGGIHTVFVPLGGLMLLIGLGLLVTGALGAAGAVDGLPAELLGPGIPLTLTGLIFFLVGRGVGKAAKKAAWLRANGISGTGRIVQVSATGTRINGVPMMKFDLMVELPGRAPYPASAKILLNPGSIGQAVPGATLAVRVDPNVPTDLIIEGD